MLFWSAWLKLLSHVLVLMLQKEQPYSLKLLDSGPISSTTSYGKFMAVISRPFLSKNLCIRRKVLPGEQQRL